MFARVKEQLQTRLANNPADAEAKRNLEALPAMLPLAKYYALWKVVHPILLGRPPMVPDLSNTTAVPSVLDTTRLAQATLVAAAFASKGATANFVGARKQLERYHLTNALGMASPGVMHHMALAPLEVEHIKDIMRLTGLDQAVSRPRASLLR